MSNATIAKLLLVALSFCWGLSWTAMRVALDEVSPWGMRLIGYSIGAATLLILLKAQTSRTLGLRLGYSAACWIVGVSAYLASFFFVNSLEGGIPRGAHHIFHFYLLMAVPVAIATAVVTIFLRPLFLLGVSRLYTELIDVKEEVERDVGNIPRIERRFLSGRVFLFLAILFPLLGAIFFSDELGLSQWIAQLGHLDVQRYFGHR